MGRIVAIDYGAKRTGIAVTDPLQIIATPLDTVVTGTIFDFLRTYRQTEPVDALVVGMPKRFDNSDTHATPLVNAFIKRLREQFADIPVHAVDERFTSKLAVQAMVAGGMKKKDRRDKANVDKISAVIILQSYLDSRR